MNTAHRQASHQKREGITASYVSEFLNYDQETGLFTWKKAVKKCQLFGQQAGHLNRANGYWYMTIKRVGFTAHRLAWLISTGSWPKGDIDHINGDRSDNRFENLRDVSSSVNQQNRRKPQSNNTSGFLGVRPHRKRWQAILTINGKPTPLGTYDTPEEAHSVYVLKKREVHKGCTL